MTEQELRDAKLAADFVTPPTPHNATINLADYDPEWPHLFDREAARIRAALGDRIVLLEHVGSTSIPGMAAKPRIDILLVVPDSSDEMTYVPQLEAAGYVLTIREPDWHEHRVFKGPDTDVNLHVFSPGSVEIRRMLGFREWVGTHPEDFERYLDAKRTLSGQVWRWVQDYADAKSRVVEEIIARAGLPPGEGEPMTADVGTAVDEALVEAALGRLDLEAKVALLTGHDFWKLNAAPAAGLRAIALSDGPCGAKGTSADRMETATALPSPTSLAASWDEELAREVAHLLAKESRDKDIDVLLAPMLNLHRSPVAGRHFEAYSEDPLLTGRIGVAYVNGLQERGVAACIKHYVCNDSETDRRDVSAQVDERTLHELYLAPFERTVREASPWTAMAAYNWVNGVPMTQNPLLEQPLKGEWGWDGMLMSDWIATYSTDISGRGGLDLVMPGPDGPWGDALLAAVRDGRVPEAAIDEKVRRILRLGARVGALAGVAPARPVGVARSGFGAAETAALARRASVAGSVLLRNDGLLPLDLGHVRRIALLGAGYASAPAAGGGSSFTRPTQPVSVLDGLRAGLPPDVQLLTLPWDAHRHTPETLTAHEVRLPASAGARAGQPGVLATVFDETGTEVLRELRPDGDVVWSGAPQLRGTRWVEVATQVVSDVNGRHRLGVATKGDMTVWIDGKQVLEQPLPAAVRAAPWPWDEGMAAAVEVELVAGQPTDVRVRAYKHFAMDIFSITLGLQRPFPALEDGLRAAEQLAAAADVAIVLVGTTQADESEGGDRKSLALPAVTDELVRRVAAANPRTAVVLAAGAPVLLPWRDQVAALLLTWFPGQEGGNALADMLLGRAEPGGRLPTTWPARTEDVPVLNTTPVNGVLAYDEGLFIGYRAWLRAGTEPAFAFGHGLGFTEWEYAAISAAGNAAAPSVRVTLRNAGARAGREVVQLYVSRPDSVVERPERWLAGWALVNAEPGQTVDVVIPIDPWALRHWDTSTHGWATEPGDYQVAVGRSVADLRLRTTVSA